MIDTEGRVEKFQKRLSQAEASRKVYAAKLAAKKAKEDAQKAPQAPKSLREIMKEAAK